MVVGRTELVMSKAGMATMVITAVVGMVITLATAIIMAMATAIITTVATILANMPTSDSMGMIAGIIGTTNAATTTIAAIDLGSHPET
ncbi:MAG: hypothetical protein CL680_18340 [Blastomonas sp.]|jgi:hypothetical protein|nr:hypothetical protein [Blastomonas sp.]|tara:strand:+ start:9838 stop:10101 length:264 start_codon:yes stop_codon:yes gene_type:complete